MSTVPTMPGRVVTIDRARLTRMRVDTVLGRIGSSKGTRRLVLLALVTAFFAVRAGWPAVLVALAPPLGQVCWWWLQTRNYARNGLGVGQDIRVDYAASGEIGLTDSTGEYWLPRGSAMAVVRFRGNVNVYGRTLSFVVPTEVFTDADAAFLEGHGEEPHEPTTPGPDLPLSLTMTADIQQRTVAAATSQLVRSADFLQPWISGLGVVAFVAVVGFAVAGPAGAVKAGLVAALIMGGLASGTLFRLSRTRASLRAAYATGQTIRGRVDVDGMVLSLPHGTQSFEWRQFSRVRVTRDAVLLRKQRRVLAGDGMVVLPVRLFDDAALGALVAAVPRRF